MNAFNEQIKQCKEYEQAIILPQNLIDKGPRWGQGGVCDKDNCFIQESYYDGGWATHGGYYQFDQEDYIDEEVVYIGLFFSHWGHFLIDLSTRFWGIVKVSENHQHIKVAYLGDEIPGGNFLRVFELLGVNKEQLIQITKPTRFKKVYIPEQAFKSCEWYTQEHLFMLDTIIKRSLVDLTRFEKLKDIKKVYFTRRQFWKAQESEFGEQYFEDFFNVNGYTSIAPESLTLEEQIFIWNNAEAIACINGTIPLNVVFSKNNNLKVTILNKTSIEHENPYILFSMREIEAEYINIFDEPFKKYPKSLGEGPYLLKITDDFLKYKNKYNLEEPYNNKATNLYFKREYIRYLLAIIGLKKKSKLWISKHFPKILKNLIHKYLKV